MLSLKSSIGRDTRVERESVVEGDKVNNRTRNSWIGEAVRIDLINTF